MMKQILKVISLLSLVFGVEAAKAGCEGLAINSQPALVLMNSENDAPQTLTVSRNNGASGTCSFLILIDNADGSSSNGRYLEKGGQDTIRIQFYKTAGHGSNIIRSATDATQLADAIQGSMANNVYTATVTYHPYIDSSWVASAAVGPHIERFNFLLYSINGSNFSNKVSVNTNASTQYRYTVDDSMSLSLVNDGSLYNAADVTQTLDFGTLTTGESLAFDLWLVYASGYKLSLISTNGGYLKNTAVATSNLVPYTLSLDNVSVALSSVETVVKTGTGASPVGGTKVDVTATIGNVGTVYAGTYNDYVTFKIAAP